MDTLAGRRVLVTGASSGIGAATARACAAAGARVACLARRSARVEEVARAVAGVPVAADVTDAGAVRSAVDAAADALGGLDALVNNAGVMRLSTVAGGDLADWRLMFEVNVLGLLAATQAALPHLGAAAHADVVNVSSMAGRRVPSAATGVYSASKHAVHALSIGLRRELEGSRVRVTIVSPGIVDTDLGQDTPDDTLRASVAQRQAEVGLSPDDVARAIVHAVAEPPEVNTLEIAVLPTAQGG